MKVVVVGATGNCGTAVLRALAAEPRVTSVLGVARRLPDVDTEPYRSAGWARYDVGHRPPGVPESDLVDELADLFRGADAVIHLAWLLQPDRDRALLRRANVGGSQRVADAVARAGVPQLVVASSVGAYSPVADDEPRDESWRTGGVRTARYSVDKTAQERVLDRLEAEHPEVTVTRLRPALVFQGDAGASVGRYFLGPFVPRWLLRPGTLPVVPLPAGLRLQAVHADDLAQAYLAAVLTKAGGAFNIATDPVLRTDDLARVLGQGRVVELPVALVRRVVAIAWLLRLVPVDAGWVDIAMGAPVMDTSRARTELGWRPTRCADDAAHELLEGVADGRGIGSIPLRPRGAPVLPQQSADT
ncbi:NAD-dependent epimerase/dehydratase family protein [Sanguibacter suaedae]|uniref:NAD-dependent epimerase/dehydratase family protein n=1 Tax=Sanguibacter suaedae TaxID=2795737 RepID=A0A934I8S5_9MICO|nr:NAD-dependent epimerase/dehydratase family protein [Sanguibacter suaedae]MBI9113496.1 NAD-dependent epimerase/dehydratase family protein [Sanguibacter suaedae]